MRRLAVLLLLAAATLRAEAFTYADSPGALIPGVVVLDVRSQERCTERTLAGARCLPAQEFMGAHRGLPAWRDVRWLFSLAGFDGSEQVLVIGDEAERRDFVAALLYLAGQREVLVARNDVAWWLARGAPAGAGMPRPVARQRAYTAPMREELVVLPHEIAEGALLLDVRPEAEYWGETVRAQRGGHLPGAQSLPVTELDLLPLVLAALPRASADAAPIVYGHDPVDGLAAFTRLVAGHGLTLRMMPAGFVEWARHADWLLHGQTLPEARPGPALPLQREARPQEARWLAAFGLALVAGAAGFYAGRRRS